MFLSNVKRKIKSNSFLYELLMSYRVSGQYGYIRTNREVSRLYCAVLKVKGANNTTEICQDSRFVFIGDKNPDSTMRTAVFGDIDKGNTKECQCEFFTSRCLKNPNLNGLHNIFWRVNKIVPLPFKSFWDCHYTTYDLKIDSDKNNYIIFLAGAYFEETFSQPNLWKKIAVESGGGTVK